jgi:carboxyl-terminal processing protease
MKPKLPVVVYFAATAFFASPLVAQDARRSGDASGSSGAVQAEIFERALEEIANRHQSAVSDSVLWTNALQGLLESLDDPYAEVFTPSEVEAFDEENTGNYSGIGVQITELNGDVTVTKVFRGTPADEVGLVEGDVIVGVDSSDARDWSTGVVSDSIRGPAGTDVRVVVAREGFDEPVPFVITRAEVHVPAVEADLIAGDVGYITIDRFARRAAVEVDSVLREIPSARGIVLDLRRNPGGFLDEALKMADVFLQRGQKLASLRERSVGEDDGTNETSFTDGVSARIPDKPIVVLVDGFTASASEIVAGALQDHDRALIVGDRTFGKGVVQTVLDLPHGYKLRMTTGTWHTPLGRSLHRARAADGRPVPEDTDTFPEVTTPGGRTLVAAGGVFPDLPVTPDTLRIAERELLQAAQENEVPLGVRLQEFGFAQAKELKALGLEPQLRGDAFQAFVALLVEEGLPSDRIENPEAREYLEWRARLATADRMLDIGAAAEIRMERDHALAEAVRLMRASRTQPELYALAEAAVASGDEGTGELSGGS